jgi:hypothetical protein
MLKKNPHNIMAAIAASVITGCSQIPQRLCGWPSFVRENTIMDIFQKIYL